MWAMIYAELRGHQVKNDSDDRYESFCSLWSQNQELKKATFQILHDFLLSFNH